MDCHRQRFAELVLRPDPEIDLGEAALLIAAEGCPGLDVDGWLARLDELGDTLRPRLAGVACEFARLSALLDYVYGDLGLRGNTHEYYDPRNSFLNEVLERRLGIPITLGLACMELGRRVGVPLAGVGFPGHFLLRHARHPQVVLDPFDGGRFLTLDDCAELLERVSGGTAAFHPRLLRPLGPRQILLRMLCNLRGIYAIRGAARPLLTVLDRLDLLCPDGAEPGGERGTLHPGAVN
ncbi:MAG TPA: transglutaminase-like domain-containing protein [Thermoanaerobaculia bacterium]|nr:transglutaminase-like domain-containing protein [Thermoanaerobaculia bacterium]